MSFSTKLRNARNKAKLSQSAVQKKLFITQQAYANYENDISSPNPETLIKIADILGVSVDYLLDREEQDFMTVDNIFPMKTKKVPLLGTSLAASLSGQKKRAASLFRYRMI